MGYKQNVFDIPCGFPKNPHGILSYNKDAYSSILISRHPFNEKGSAWEYETPLLSFIHFSDIHGDKERLRRIVDFMDDMKGQFEDCISTGDSVLYYYGNGMDFWNSVPGAEKIINIVGNHDALDNSQFKWEFRIPQEEQAKTFIEPYISHWGNVRYTPGTTYFAKDYPENKISIIALNAMLRGEDKEKEFEFFKENLGFALENSYSVIVLNHDQTLLPQKDSTVIECNYTEPERPPSSPCDCGVTDIYQKEVENFINAGGDFICYLTGDTHQDMLQITNAYPRQMFVAVGTASLSKGLRASNTPRFSGDISEDLLNYTTFDTKKKLIKIIRIGAYRDYLMRSKKITVINYETGKIVYEE